MDRQEEDHGTMRQERHFPKPPAHVQRYVDALGVELTIDFLLNFGGAELFLPADPGGKSEVERVIGRAGF
jgi:hypothetical protein